MKRRTLDIVFSCGGVALAGLYTGDLGVATQHVGLDDDGDPVAPRCGRRGGGGDGSEDGCGGPGEERQSHQRGPQDQHELFAVASLGRKTSDGSAWAAARRYIPSDSLVRPLVLPSVSAASS